MISRIKDWIIGLIKGSQCGAINKKLGNMGLYCQKRSGHLGKHIDICGDKWRSK